MFAQFLIFLIWFIFLSTAVVDAKEQRIPNRYLVILLLSIFVEKIFYFDPLEVLSEFVVGGVILFSGCLLLFGIRAMAPGDVKLMGVVGFWVGYGQALNAAYWIALSAVVVGCCAGDYLGAH